MHTRRSPVLALFIVLSLSALSAPAQEEAPKAEPAGAPQAAIDHWRDLRFGMFIHWGPVSLTGREIGWSRGRETPIEQYDQLYKQFNPTEFDADTWVQTAKDAGMKYMVITTKHHDGFCLWPSKHTDYDIGETPFGRDVLKELSEACRKQGLEFGTYYSVCDWHHPDFPLGSPGGKTRKPNPNLDRYVEYMQGQVTELITNYGPLSTMWFDVPQQVGPEHGKPTEAIVRRLQPNIVINNRGYGGPSGDYDTPEQRVGGFNRQRPWETCMTICRQWAWKPDDQMKSLEQCVRTLLSTIGGDGNLLFNVGPMPDGRIEPRQVERLREMGAWINKHAEAIYGTRGGPWKPGPWGASTCRDDAIYLFIMTWPEAGPLQLPKIDAEILSVTMAGGGTVKWTSDSESLTLDIPNDRRDPIATMVKLTVRGKALDIAPVSPGSVSGALTFDKKAEASNVFHQQLSHYGPDKALDEDATTRWATDAGTHAAWLEVDLGEPQAIARVMIDEPAEYQRVRAFELQYLDGQTWKTFFRGTTIGPHWSQKLDTITARRVRLNITEAVEGPTLWEFQLFGPKK